MHCSMFVSLYGLSYLTTDTNEIEKKIKFIVLRLLLLSLWDVDVDVEYAGASEE